jgi:hypothetical protein
LPALAVVLFGEKWLSARTKNQLDALSESAIAVVLAAVLK